MERITKAKYMKAVRVVAAYEKQQRAGKFQFLYWLEEDIGNDERVKEKIINAKDIDEACKKFLLIKSSDTAKVDYEVMFDGGYFDISQKTGFENLI
jgi:hypothetical protein